MKTVIEMAREAGDDWDSTLSTDKEFLERFAKIVRADEREQGQKWFDAVAAQHKQAILAEREACAKKTEEFARKWWKIHCDSNLHYSSTLKAHQDFCALQAAIRARSCPPCNEDCEQGRNCPARKDKYDSPPRNP